MLKKESILSRRYSLESKTGMPINNAIAVDKESCDNFAPPIKRISIPMIQIINAVL